MIAKDSRLIKISPFLDQNELLRVNRRIEYLPGSQEKFQLLILDAKHPVTQLILKYYHEKFYHKNFETIINELQQKFWILSLRKTLRSIISKCVICKMIRGLPNSPKMAQLPDARLGYRFRPFNFCGIDYFGPIMVKVGRRREKRWGVLFTCVSIRAIHLELAHSLSTDSAIMAIQRFAARRGFPRVIISDNGTNFKGANLELREAISKLHKEKQLDFALKNNFEWRFNPPTASHMGGAWERLIRSVKESLHVILKEHAPKEETLLTVLAEIEHSVNSRPLTVVPSDPQEKEALTPNHFLIGTSSATINLCQSNAEICTKKQWRIAQFFADAFWRRWFREYLPLLLPRKKWVTSDDPLEEGDLVLIVDNQTPRNHWRKGVVIRIFPAKDGEVRIVELKTATGFFTRPSRKLVKLSEVAQNI